MSVFLSNTHTPPPYNHAIFFLPVHVHICARGNGQVAFFLRCWKKIKNKNIQVASRIQPYTPPQFGFTCGAIAS